MKSPQCLHVRSEICFRELELRLVGIDFCGGGCKRMQRETACMPGDTFCGYQAFLDHALRPLMQIAAGILGWRKRIMENRRKFL